MAQLAAERARAGATAEDIVSLVTDLAGRLHLFAAVETVEFLRRSGRISLVQAGIASMLNAKPILKLSGGVLKGERMRTLQRAVERVVELAAERRPWEKIAVIHTNARARAEALTEQLAARYAGAVVDAIQDVTPAIGVHVGPGARGLMCLAGWRE